MQEALDRLKEIDATLCDRINALCGQGETVFTNTDLCYLNKARDGLWRARRALESLEEKPCEKS